MLHWARKGTNLIDTYYFHLRARGPVAYIVAVRPGKWDPWRADWAIMQADPHNHLVLPIGALIGNKDLWEELP
jgi:hypothetical protein